MVRCLQRAAAVRGEVFLVSDGVPVSRRNIAAAAALHPAYRESAGAVTFTGGEEVDGKKYDSSKIRKVLGWSPKYDSFASFMERVGGS